MKSPRGSGSLGCPGTTARGKELVFAHTGGAGPALLRTQLPKAQVAARVCRDPKKLHGVCVCVCVPGHAGGGRGASVQDPICSHPAPPLQGEDVELRFSGGEVLLCSEQGLLQHLYKYSDLGADGLMRRMQSPAFFYPGRAAFNVPYLAGMCHLLVFGCRQNKAQVPTSLSFI